MVSSHKLSTKMKKTRANLAYIPPLKHYCTILSDEVLTKVVTDTYRYKLVKKYDR